jgi:prophage regulatory protein
MLWQLSLKPFSYEIAPAYLSLLKEGSWRICLIGNINLLDSEQRPKNWPSNFYQPFMEILMNNNQNQVPPITLMRIPQILKVMPVSKSKFWLMVQKGEFPKPIKIGRSSFWTIEQVQSFIKERADQAN